MTSRQEYYAQMLEGRMAGARPWNDITQFAIYQDTQELSGMLAWMDERGGIGSYLEIGTASGALLEFMLRELKVRAYGIDINPPAKAALKRRMYLGDSSSKPARDWAARRAPFDLVFIDGGHSYEQALTDYLFYKGMATRYIAFHDIAHDHWRGVVQLWGELEEEKVEFINPGIPGLGIGVVVLS